MKLTQTKVLDGDRFIYHKGYWVGENGEILSVNHKVLKSFPSVNISGKNHRRANLIAELWLGKPSEKANLIHKDGNKKNCRVDNLEYKTVKNGTFKHYREEVDELTNLQPLHLMKDFDKRGFNSFHVDHIISVKYGHKHKIEPSEIASICNLQMLSKDENCTKINRCYSVLSQCDHIKKIKKSTILTE